MKCDFGKDFLKLMNSSVFANTMDNVRKHQDMQTIMKRNAFQKIY